MTQPNLSGELNTPAAIPSKLPWLACGAAVLVALGLLFGGLFPAQKERDRAQAELEKIRAEFGAEETKLKEALKDSETLAGKHAETQEELKAALAEKEAALKALADAQKDLTATLQAEIAAGDVLIRERRGELTIDVSDKLLFEEGEAAINDRGKALLAQVAKSMNRLPAKQRFQVGGHTDSQRVVSKGLVEKYPTNWELSTARAANVVRDLQENGKVAGRRLIAAGFSQYRPRASNNSKAGRHMNRRIEIVLLQDPPKK